MNKTALYALLLALVLPLVAYFIVKSVSANAVLMPPKYYVDTVIERTIRGKLETDTIWHTLPDISMINHLGERVGWDDMRKDTTNKIIVANFFFTRCPTICPGLTMNMKMLQESVKKNQKVGDRTADYVQFLSFSVDPERDDVQALKRWADRFQINPVNWWLITGDKKEIYDLSINHMKLALADGEGVDTSFIHTDRFVLIDRDRIVRGYYHGLDTADIARLAQDIVFLSLEKDPKRKGFFAGKLELIAVVFLITLIGLGIFLFVLKRTKHVKS